MPLKYILARVGRKVGLDPANANERLTMLYDINEACRELYDQSDMPNSLWEQVFKINGDQTITLPSYIGTIRALRETDSQVAWSVNQMRPRYNQFNWPDMWRNWRLKNTTCLQASVDNQSIGVLTVPAIENPPISVTVTGPAQSQSRASETIVMDALQKQTVNSYFTYESFTKDTISKYDVTLSQVDGKVLSVLPDNEFEAFYQNIDISECPWLAISTSTLDHYVELLYKKKLPIMWNDSDEFPALGYDDIIVNKVMQLRGEEQGKPDVAMAYDAKATRSLARKTENQNRETEDMIALVANPHDVILPRIRQGRRKYYRGFGSRGYGY